MIKKRVAAAILVLVAVWPVVHYVLVERYDIDPWRFFGFAMYAVPPSYQWVHLLKPRGEGETLIYKGHLSLELQRQYEKYRRHRGTLGELLPPHRLAAAILEEKQEIGELRIVVIRDVLSPATARVEERGGYVYTYRRQP